MTKKTKKDLLKEIEKLEANLKKIKDIGYFVERNIIYDHVLDSVADLITRSPNPVTTRWLIEERDELLLKRDGSPDPWHKVAFKLSWMEVDTEDLANGWKKIVRKEKEKQ